MRLAIFASGTGSNAVCLIEAAQANQFEANVALVISDKQGAPVLEKAAALGVRAEQVLPAAFESKKAYEQAIVALLQQEQIDLILLAGYMRLIGPTLLGAYEGKIVNIHPSLLPHFPGLDAIGQALDAGVSETGVTVHYVDDGMDTGPIIAQETIPLTLQETRESLTKKVQTVEHSLYPAVVKQLVCEQSGRN
ncbi:phosphoribosylglycinamide formyltransferase [Bacillus sp. JCM 19046]|nr:phosphoribosylglycinamide formyltransferase [Bacillus sp. JCM 19045]GAF17309.1 phosphoribosylglycinamide formyltransferase [Bacillus sp. JCM 19046]